MFLENPSDLPDDNGDLQTVMAGVDHQLGSCARVVCTGIGHLAVAPTRADSVVQDGDDRMPLDGRLDGQAVDGQEKGTRSRAEGDSRSAANQVRQHESRSSRHRARGNPVGRVGVVGPTQVALAPNLTSQQGQRNTPRGNSRTSVLVAQATPASSSVRSSSLRRESIHARRNPFRRYIPARGGSLWAGTIVSAGPTSRRVLRARYNRNHPERLLRPAQCRGALIPVVLPRMRGILTSTEIAPCPRRPSKLARPVMESTFGWERCLPQREKADRHDDARILPGNSIVGVIGRPALQYVLNTGDSPPAIWRAIVWAWK